MTATFFGHRDTPQNIAEVLGAKIEELIVSRGVDEFYVGDSGAFDRMVLAELTKLEKRYPFIRYCVVLAYMPTEKKRTDAPTLYPEGLESVPPRFAITHRNRFMADRADIAVAYVRNRWGGAFQALDYARRKGREIINLAEWEQ